MLRGWICVKEEEKDNVWTVDSYMVCQHEVQDKKILVHRLQID